MQEKLTPKTLTKREEIRLKKEEINKVLSIINAKIDYLKVVNDSNDNNDD